MALFYQILLISETHKENVRKYHQSIFQQTAEENETKPLNQNEGDCFKRLDELVRQEEELGELSINTDTVR